VHVSVLFTAGAVKYVTQFTAVSRTLGGTVFFRYTRESAADECTIVTVWEGTVRVGGDSVLSRRSLVRMG